MLGFGKKTKDKVKKSFKEELKSLFIFGVIIFAIRSVFFEPFKIPSGSMIPTLMIGDFILVNKMAYGFKVPFSDMYWDPIYLSPQGEVKRGEVIVFKYPKDPDINYIKRVVGLPGETVEIKDKVVFINGTPIESLELDGAEIMSDMDDKFKNYNLKFFQAKTGTAQHVIQLNQDSFYNTDFGPYEVPMGHYFVMGDNRDFSSDSRFWGTVPFSHIKGRAIWVWFSFIAPWSEDPMRLRLHRIGTEIR